MRKGEKMSKTRQFQIGDQTHTFTLNMKSFIKADEKYGNYGTILKGIMEGDQFYTNCLKLLTVACQDKELEFDELVEKITNEQVSKLDQFVIDLYADFRGIESKKNTEEKKPETERNKSSRVTHIILILNGCFI